MGSITGHVGGEVAVNFVDLVFIVTAGHDGGDLVAVHDDVDGVEARVGGDCEAVADTPVVVVGACEVIAGDAVKQTGGVVEGLAEDEVEGVGWHPIRLGAENFIVLALHL